MAVTKASSSTQFVTRASVMSGRESAANGHWVPNTDVYATDTGLIIKVELAGMRSENLEITVEGNRLRISGDRPDSCRASRASFLVMEINYGPFESILELPSGYDLGQAKASYLNGFLRIDVPAHAPAPHHKATRLTISDGK
jgi:HSP20 family protein